MKRLNNERKAFKLLPFSGCSVDGWAVVVLSLSSLLVVGIPSTTDDDVAGSLTEGVTFISFDELLTVADVIDSWFVAVAGILIVVLALKDIVDFVIASCVDTEDEASPL